MAEFTLEEAYGMPAAKPKQRPYTPLNAPQPVPIQTATPAVAPELTPKPPPAGLTPKALNDYNLAEANRLAAMRIKQQEEALKEANPLGSISEGERKAATLLSRLQFSENQLQDVLKKNPTATKPNLLPQLLEPVSETAANYFRSTPRQQIESAQMDLLDAALTLGTGASYTKEQLKSYRESYFPQINDDLPTIQDKQARLSNIIEAAKIAAGRAAKLVPEVKTGNKLPSGAPPDAKQAPDGNWYSPDPKRPGKYLQWSK